METMLIMMIKDDKDDLKGGKRVRPSADAVGDDQDWSSPQCCNYKVSSDDDKTYMSFVVGAMMITYMYFVPSKG